MIFPVKSELYFFLIFIIIFCRKWISWFTVLSLRSPQHSRDLDGVKCLVAKLIKNHKRKITHHPLTSTLTWNASASLQGFVIWNMSINIWNQILKVEHDLGIQLGKSVQILGEDISWSKKHTSVETSFYCRFMLEDCLFKSTSLNPFPVLFLCFEWKLYLNIRTN